MAQRITQPTSRPRRPQRQSHPLGTFECLEPRRLLHAPNGGAWPHPELITVSFMPDGTDIGGTPSNLFATMDVKWPTATWQDEILRGLQEWAASSNLNFSVVPDDGSPFGSAGNSGSDNNVQGDSSFGDIRIGAYDMGDYLGIGMLPPPINGDTTAGDFFLNSAKTWNIGASFDLLTVASHEAGHGLGLDHSSIFRAVMYPTYNGVKSSLTPDDSDGIRAVYSSRSQDAFDAASENNGRLSASVINSQIDQDKQITLTGLDVTSASDHDWYKLTVPKGSASNMTVRMQSEGLSLLAPALSLYNSKGRLIQRAAGASNTSVELTQRIKSGQTYFMEAAGAETSVFGIGAYALQVNLGTAPLPPVPLPDTATAASDGGGNSSGMFSGGGAFAATTNAVELFDLLLSLGRAEVYETLPETNVAPHGELTTSNSNHGGKSECKADPMSGSVRERHYEQDDFVRVIDHFLGRHKDFTGD